MKRILQNNLLRCAQIILFLPITFASVYMLRAQTSNPVGAIPGAIDVSPMGAAIYTIPIEVVPGTQGMQPNLSIIYNSMSGMGLLGMKWNLTGLSAITRCGQTPYYDSGNITAIQFNGNDRYAINGDRLIRINGGSYADVVGEYATEIENFTRIVSYGGISGHPAHFKAFTDDGSIIEYGNTTNSKQTVVTNKVLSWFINKITDANGNYMTFTYEESGDFRIKEINYTGNSSNNTATYAKVEFKYKFLLGLWGSNTYFVGGYGIPQESLLDKITVSYKGTVVRKYEFHYNMNIWESGTVHLEKIVLSGVEGAKQLNPTTIEWGSKITSHEEKFTNVRCAKTITGDFNGDGHSDIIYYDEQGWHLELYNPTTNLFEEKASELNVNCVIMHAQDLNGDGKDELIIGNVKSTNGKDTLHVRILSLPDKTQIGSTLKYAVYSEPSYNQLGYIGFGDFDNDGVTDILLYEGGGATHNGVPFPPSLLRLKKIVGNNHVDMLNLPGGYGIPANTVLMSGIAKINILDANGDGRKNIQVERNGTTTIYELEGSNLVPKFTNPAYHSYSHKYYGDVNGDGITDVLVFCYENQVFKWKIFIGKGDGTFIEGDQTFPESNISNALDVTAANPGAGNASAPKYEPRFADINGDGKEDIIQKVGNNFIILYSKGVVWGAYAFIKETVSFDNPSNYYTEWCLGDFDGVGKLKFLLTRPDHYMPQKIVSINQDSDYEFVKKITDGIGKKIQLDYKRKYFIATSQSWNNVFPYRQRKYFLSLIDSLKVSNGKENGLHIYHYQYSDPAFSLARRTFLGFKEFVTTDNQSNIKDSYSFWMDFPSKQMLTPRRRRIGFQGDERISEREYSISFRNLPGTNTRFALNYDIIEDYDVLSNTTVVTCNFPNSHGRLMESFSKTHNGLSPNLDNWMHMETKNYTYNEISLSTANNHHKKTVPTLILTTQHYKNNNTQIVQTADTLTYGYYDATHNGRLKWVRKGNAHGSITTSYEKYTPAGLYQEKTVSAAGCIPRTEKYEYDNTHRFLTQITNPLGHRTIFTYDTKTGNKLSETNANNLTTTYQYDSFGNLTQVNYPDGTQTDISVDWYSSSFLPNARYTTYTTTTGRPPLRIYYDILGREVCRREDNNYFETRYNDRGLVERTSYPFGAFIDPRIWHEYEYDYLGRKLEEKAPYIHLSYEYGTRSVTIIDYLNGVSSLKNYDALGRIIQAEDAGGFIDYSYAVTGSGDNTRHKTVVTIDDATTTILSDLWGNRRSITEPNAGEITSKYNGFNELIEQVDANGNITTYQYDRLGRVVRKEFVDQDENEQTIVYGYDVGSNARGKLTAIYMDNVRVERFTYNNLSRLITHSKVIDEDSYAFHYTYTANGQLGTLTYPTGFSVEYSYTPTGKLNEIRRGDNNNLIYRVNTRHSRYHVPTRCEYGNGVVTEYTYTPHGLLTRIKTGNKVPVVIGGGGGVHSSGGILQGGLNSLDDNPNSTNSLITEPAYTVDSVFLNYRYAYDDRGLIISRSESVINYMEEYEYDKLHRLTGIALSSTGKAAMPQTFSYHANGNFESNSALGVYSYQTPGIDGVKAHAVSGVTKMSVDIFENSCDVTYNFFNQPAQIIDGYRLELSYGANQQRQKMVRYRKKMPENIRHYVNKHYEREEDYMVGSINHYHYIYGDNGVVALYVDYETAYTDSMYYIHTDHLGSYCAITNPNKKVVQRNYFDPWGNVIPLNTTHFGSPNNSNIIELPPTNILNPDLEHFNLDFPLTNRGFTGHEHYPALKIINMNGRLYDPVIARFFSPDKYVLNSSFTQDFNRYTYARNNPLMYTDPSGEFVHLIVGAVFGGLMNWMVNGAEFSWKGLGYFGTGAGVGFSSGFVTGAGNAWMSGANFGQGLWGGVKGGLIAGGTGGLMGGLTGGIDAALDGRNFWDGGPTLKTKLEILTEQYRAQLLSEIGEADATVQLGTRKNLAGTDHKAFGGKMYSSNGDEAAGFARPGKAFGLSSDGYPMYGDNEIYLSRKTVRGMWKGHNKSIGTLFHEWQHGNDFFTGMAESLYQNFGSRAAIPMLEYRAHTIANTLYPSPWRQERVDYYFNFLRLWP